MAVEPLLATRAQRAFIFTSKSIDMMTKSTSKAYTRFKYLFVSLLFLTVPAQIVSVGCVIEAIVVLVMVGITFRMVSPTILLLSLKLNFM
jgi:hypothetical protein